jgi:hypothetical protein
MMIRFVLSQRQHSIANSIVVSIASTLARLVLHLRAEAGHFYCASSFAKGITKYGLVGFGWWFARLVCGCECGRIRGQSERFLDLKMSPQSNGLPPNAQSGLWKRVDAAGSWNQPAPLCPTSLFK